MDGSFVASGEDLVVNEGKVGFFPRRVTLISPRGTIDFWEGMIPSTGVFKPEAGGGVATLIENAGADEAVLILVAARSGLSFAIVVAGNNTALSHSFNAATGRITINSATDGGGVPTTTLATIAGILMSVYGALISSAEPDNGAKVLAAVSATDLLYVTDGGVSQVASGFALSEESPINVDGDVVHYFCTG
jgi:hypothetical protein